MAKIEDWNGHIGRRLRLRDLNVFLTVVQLGSMAKAAAQMRVTQPAVSQIIGDLEHALGVRLLDRSPRGIEPTLYGKALIKGGSIAFDELKQTIKEIEFLADPTAGEVRIGCPETVAAVLSPVIEQLSLHYPGIVVHISDVVAPTLDVPQIRNRSLDIALLRIAEVPELHHYGDDLNVELLFIDEMVVVAGKDNPLTRRKKLDIADLATEPWILPPDNSLNRKVVVEAFRLAGLSPPAISLVTFSVQLRANLLARGRYLTVFPLSMMQIYSSQMPLKILPVKLPSLQWPMALVTLKNRTLNPIAQLFIREMHAWVKSMKL